MPAPLPLKVLCVHGVNTPDAAADWQRSWTQAIEGGVHRWQPSRPVQVEFVAHNDLFRAAPLGPIDYIRALARLLASGVSTAVGSVIPRTRGFSDVTQAVRWTAGMVVQWVDNEGLRARARARVAEAVRKHNPDVVMAHSLGSLLCYDTFTRGSGRSVVRGKTFISFGSQIGNPFIRDTFGGRLVGIGARYWYHLFNQYDGETFTWPIRLPEPAFSQISTAFNLAGILDHDATCYLSHAGMLDTVWPEILSVRGRTRSRLAPSTPTVRPSAARPPQTARRALLVGINEYPEAADRLEGCVNDVFLMSSLLQESGFDAEDIRVVLDDRATARGIRDRLEWLLEDAREEDQRVFFYSGHGAQLPAYSPLETIDHKDECLVPHDFDWSVERAVTDKQFLDLYSQLSYGVRFISIFDCCYSGGMTREGGTRVRGLTPPDDIRHRELRWDRAREMWRERTLDQVNRSLRAGPDGAKYVGVEGSSHRLGRAAPLRRLNDAKFDRVREELDHKGPYMPLLLEACGEGQLASEYRHGVTSYGAFTYCLAKILRNERKQGKNPTFDHLVRMVAKDLGELGYEQVPMVVGPRKLTRAEVPWWAKKGSRVRKNTRGGRHAR